MKSSKTSKSSKKVIQKEMTMEDAIKSLEKEYGKGVIIKMGEATNHKGVECFSSGSLILDEALGIGGYPKGRIIEIYGPESSGKTTLALHAVAEAQKQGGVCTFIDAEHALDINYAGNIGVNVKELYLSQPENGEQALEIVDNLVASGSVDLIVVDSVAALTPKSEIEGNMGDAHMAVQARLMSQALRKITGSLYRSKTTLIFINQLRMKVGVFFGSPETTTGGNALKFYSSVRLDVRKMEVLKKEEQIYGSKLKVKVVKNKLSPPFRVAETVIIYGRGIPRENELLSLAVKNDIIKKSGSWFSYREERIGQGQDNCLRYLKENTATFQEIEKKVIASLKDGENARVENSPPKDEEKTKEDEGKTKEIKKNEPKEKKGSVLADDFFDDLD